MKSRCPFSILTPPCNNDYLTGSVAGEFGRGSLGVMVIPLAPGSVPVFDLPDVGLFCVFAGRLRS